jgi:hypothetical protein
MKVAHLYGCRKTLSLLRPKAFDNTAQQVENTREVCKLP